MPISTIYRTTRHFYFNYHHPESTSLWIHSTFMRRVQFGIQKLICFLVVGFLAYGTQLNDRLSLEYLLPVVSILCLEQTFGSTVSGCYQITLVITPLSILLFAVRRIGFTGYHNYLVTELLLLFTSFCIAYGCTHVQTRKVTLLYNALYFASNSSKPDVPATFAFELLEVYIIGMVMALLISLIVFPLFATFDIQNRFNYTLSKLQQMQLLITQAFLCHDKMGAQMFLGRSSMIENMIHKALSPIQTRLDEVRFEPVRFLQRIFNRKHRHVIDLTLQEQDHFITSLMYHICSLHWMVKNCSFNDYHHGFTEELESSLSHLGLCQSIVVSNFISPSSVTKDEFTRHMTDLQDAFKSVRSSYISARLHRIKHVLEFATSMKSEDLLSHSFFFFQLSAIVQLLTRTITENNQSKTIPKAPKKKRNNLVEHIKLQQPRLLSSLKSMLIIGVGSIFIFVPRLAAAFENGQWILVTLCMTQGDTVGGAFVTMKMRLTGTLLGAIWAYITYLVVHDNVYYTLGMLSPWIFVFGYLQLLPNWGYTAIVAAFTPILINLGRLPYGDALPAGNYALLRIEESFVGITIAIVLTIIIFPVFAIDSLKDNIQTTLETCRQSVISMHSIYDQLFHHNHSDTQIELGNDKIESFIDAQRSRFKRLIGFQRTLIEHASLEPTLWWVNNSFSTKRYNTLVQQQIDTFKMLHNIDATLMRINEWSGSIGELQSNGAGGYFLADLHKELSDLSGQLNDCFCLWTSYFTLTQTRFYRLFRQCIYSHRKLIENDLSKHEQCLIELHQTIHRLHVQHQEAHSRLLAYYLDRLTQGDSFSTFIPYVCSDEADSIFVAYYSMYYSTTQLAQIALTLGETIHTIFELETTHLYRPF